MRFPCNQSVHPGVPDSRHPPAGEGLNIPALMTERVQFIWVKTGQPDADYVWSCRYDLPSFDLPGPSVDA